MKTVFGQEQHHLYLKQTCTWTYFKLFISNFPWLSLRNACTIHSWVTRRKYFNHCSPVECTHTHTEVSRGRCTSKVCMKCCRKPPLRNPVRLSSDKRRRRTARVDGGKRVVFSLKTKVSVNKTSPCHSLCLWIKQDFVWIHVSSQVIVLTCNTLFHGLEYGALLAKYRLNG